MGAGRLENGNAFIEWEMGAARKRGFKARIRDLCGYYFASCSWLVRLKIVASRRVLLIVVVVSFPFPGLSFLV